MLNVASHLLIRLYRKYKSFLEVHIRFLVIATIMILYAYSFISFDFIEGNDRNCRIKRSENLQVTDYEGGLCIDIDTLILSL